MSEHQTTCCPEWLKAQQSGTDNEGYGRLIQVYPDGAASMGSDLPPIRFCPWCGADKRPKPKDASDAR